MRYHEHIKCIYFPNKHFRHSTVSISWTEWNHQQDCVSHHLRPSYPLLHSTSIAEKLCDHSIFHFILMVYVFVAGVICKLVSVYLGRIHRGVQVGMHCCLLRCNTPGSFNTAHNTDFSRRFHSLISHNLNMFFFSSFKMLRKEWLVSWIYLFNWAVQTLVKAAGPKKGLCQSTSLD